MSGPTYENGRLMLVVTAMIDEHGQAHALCGLVDLDPPPPPTTTSTVESRGNTVSTVDTTHPEFSRNRKPRPN